MLNKFLFFCILTLSFSYTAKAQLSDPREKFSISATIESGPNSDHTWKSPSGEELAEGRTKQGVSVKVNSNIKLLSTNGLGVSLTPFYNFSNQDIETEMGLQRLGFTLPDAHHHFGGTLMVTYQMQAWGKPLTLMGMGTGNFSQYGYENASGMLGGMITVTRNKQTYLALGAIYLLGTSVAWPLFPMFVYSHRFNNHWSISLMETNNYLYYHATPKLKFSVGMELDTQKFYFRPETKELPERAVISQVSERLGLFADWQATNTLSFNCGIGANVPFYTRLQESGYRHSYMDMKAQVRPFVKLKAKYSIYKK